MGSAALYYLPQHNIRVLGIDRFQPGHDRGSSHGGPRVIRLAYCEHPNYVPLLRRAYELWNQFSMISRQRLYNEVELLEIGPLDGKEPRSKLPGIHENNSNCNGRLCNCL